MILVDTSRWSRLPTDCNCRIQRYCVTLDFPPLAVERAAKVPIEAPYEDYLTLEPDGMGSYVGFEHPLWPIGGQESSTPPLELPHQICFEAGDQVMFRLNPIFLAGYDLSRAVIRAGGLCIVGDLPNPRIFDDEFLDDRIFDDSLYTACSN